MANLTPKQQRFVEEYLIDLNATQAYIRAGFSEKLANTNAAKLLQNTTIAKAIEDARKEVSEKALITTEMVVKGLLKEAQDNSEGSTQSARVSAWAHLGKHMGMFTDKVQHSGKIEVSDISDDALDKRIQELESKVMQNDKRGEA